MSFSGLSAVNQTAVIFFLIWWKAITDWSADWPKSWLTGSQVKDGGGGASRAEPTSLWLSVSHGIEDVPPLHLQLWRGPLTLGLPVTHTPQLLLQQPVSHAPRLHMHSYGTVKTHMYMRSNMCTKESFIKRPCHCWHDLTYQSLLHPQKQSLSIFMK